MVDEPGVTSMVDPFGESMNLWWLILEVFSILQSHRLMLWKTWLLPQQLVLMGFHWPP